MFLVVPNLCILTVLEGYSWLFNIVQLALCAVLWYTGVTNKAGSTSKNHKSVSGNDNKRSPTDKMLFVSTYRAFMNVATILSILAVDFKIFPRRYAKAEVYGTGFMDIGVGSFIFGNAIVSQFARGTLVQGNQGFLVAISKQFFGCMPILVLGLLRLITVKGTNYDESVAEYGVHWNFFFTLAFVKVRFRFFHCKLE